MPKLIYYKVNFKKSAPHATSIKNTNIFKIIQFLYPLH